MAQAETFLALADELHFGRAAQRLRVSQPRISRLIAALEREIGGKLFERTSRRVALTPLGQQFRTELQPSHAQMLAALGRARRAACETAGALRVGFTATTYGPPLSRLLAAFEHQHPGCQVLTQEVEILDPYAALRRGEIDVLVNWLAVAEPDLTTGPAISCHDRVLATAPSHRLARRASVSIEEVAGEHVALVPQPFPAVLYDAIVPPHTPSGRPIPRTQAVRSTNEIAAHVAHGQIVHITMTGVPLFSRTDITLVPLTGLPPLRLGLIWRTAHENARIRALAATARCVHVPSSARRRQAR